MRGYLKTAQPAAFRKEQNMLQQFGFAKVAALEALRSMSQVDAQLRYVGADGGTYDTRIGCFAHAVSHLDLSKP